MSALVNQNVIIRDASPDDHEALWRILQPVIRAGDTYALPQEFSRQDTLAYWLSREKKTFVAEADGQILGTYFIKPNQFGPAAHVCNCGYITAAEARGRGIARQMCEHSLSRARKMGFRAMQYNLVVSTNTGAIGLWQKMGFEIVGTLPDAFNHPELGFVDAYVMYQML